MPNPNIAQAGALTRFKPGPDPRRRKGMGKQTNANLDNALAVALVEALDIIQNPRNPYYAEHRVHMIETIIKYASPKRKEVEVGGENAFDIAKWFRPDSGPEPATIDVTPVNQKFASNGSNGVNGKAAALVKRGEEDDEADDEE